MERFENINYLQYGNPVQQRAYTVLTKHRIIDRLSVFNPVLTGTVPIEINIASSDLDISCYWQDKDIFVQALSQFSGYSEFHIEFKIIGHHETVIASFKADEFPIEIFGQNRPVQEQYAYRHMLIEHQILEWKGEDFKQQIILLKQQGLKTEPAFCQLLGLSGNPYKALLSYQIPK